MSTNTNVEKIIEAKILDSIGTPSGYKHIEVKQITPHYYRVNVVCAHVSEGDVIPLHSRPFSWMVKKQNNNYTFSPELLSCPSLN